jgi:hypothetical protein
MPGHRMALMTGLAHTTGDLIFLSDCDLDEEPELMTQFHATFARVDWEVCSVSEALVSPSGERWLLVTSAHHIQRSVGIFRKVGFEAEPYPVDWRTGGRDDLLKFSDHFVERLSLVDAAAREWMGLKAYWITGKNSEFFTGPNER